MKRYKDDLTPREIKKGFYRNIDLGKDVVLQRIEIGNQIREMIASHVGLAGTSDTNREAANASINLLAYDNRNVGNGIYGLKASFEWNIAEVAWQIEQNVKEFKELLEIIYDSQDPSLAGMRHLAQDAYENGSMVDAIHYLLKLSQSFENDFSVFLSLGIISLFHEKDKEKALGYFNKGIEIVELQSDFYTSYTLLFKALVLRNLDRIEEAEKFSKQAVALSPDFTEALYQNAQYSALLKNTDMAISLLEKIIHVDILYCLKITNERDFNGMKSDITKIIKKISAPLNEGIKSKLKKIDVKLHSLNAVINSMHDQGLNVSDNQNVKQLNEDKDELAKVVKFDSVLNIFVVNKCLSQLDKNIQHDKSQLLSSCKNARIKVEYEKKAASNALKNMKEKKPLSPFLLYLFLSQLYAIPIGIFVVLPSSVFIEKYNVLIGMPTGIQPGVFIMETIAFFSCALMVFVPTVRPRLKWKKIHTCLQHREQRLDKTIKMIKQESLN